MPIINFPEPRRRKVILTKMMRQIISRTLSVHTLCALIVWYGETRIGKTTTAQYMVEKILEEYDDENPCAFRAKYYEVGEIAAWSGNETKKGIKSLYFAALGFPLDEGTYTKDPPEALALRLVHELRKRNIQLMFIDEAGCLSLDAIRGMVLVRDVAESNGWTLTLVFVGMDDLPQKMERLKQIDGRTYEWCYFVEYSLSETWSLLAELHPHFAELDRNNEEHREQVQFLHETYGGFPGQLIPFIHRMEYRSQEFRGKIDLRFLRATHLLTVRDKERSIQHSLSNYRGKPVGKVFRRKQAKSSDSPKGEV